ncbi:hypothetical protein [Paracoccus sp. KR1-242]|uniref:hypothetical protein n=1 Tax=Paracoccus sp. KR1-242 TaxID=3410028 RepID=UPI003C113403
MGKSKSFTNAVEQWTEQVHQASLDTFAESVRGIANEARAAMPHETGNLSRSIVVSDTAAIPLGANDEVYPDPAASDDAVLANLKLGDRVYIGSRATYFNKQEFGWLSVAGGAVTSHSGRFGMTAAMARWSAVVKRVWSRRRREG